MKDDTLLARWLAGELEAEELEALKKTPRYATLVSIKENFAQIERPHIDTDEMMENIFKQEKTAPKATKVVPLYRKAWFKGIAASIVILLGLGIIFTLPKNVSAPNGKTIAFVLPDESEVTLNAGSQSSYSTWNWDNNRVIDLDGEAYFEVAKGKTFSINTALGKVTVLGTHFNVKARENRFDVICYEGKVCVEYNGRATLLAAHQALTVENGTINGNVSTIAAHIPAWLGNELSFSKEKFSAIVAELERRYDVKISTGYKPAHTFTGSLPANDINGALKILSRLYNLEVKKQGKTILLKPVNAKR